MDVVSAVKDRLEKQVGYESVAADWLRSRGVSEDILNNLDKVHGQMLITGTLHLAKEGRKPIWLVFLDHLDYQEVLKALEGLQHGPVVKVEEVPYDNSAKEGILVSWNGINLHMEVFP